MRRAATFSDTKGAKRQCILYAADDGIFVFVGPPSGDGPAETEHWFAHLASAEEFCRDDLHVKDAWVDVGDPLPGCQEDWVAPVRVKGRASGKPEWGTFERRDGDGVWRPVSEHSTNERAG